MDFQKFSVTRLYNYLPNIPSKKNVWKYFVDTLSTSRQTCPKLYTCIDCRTSDDAISLLTLFSGNIASLDDILDKLLKIYKRFTPNEISLQFLSMESQRYYKQGGREEFALHTVYMAMNIAISETNLQSIQKNRKLTRRMSF